MKRFIEYLLITILAVMAAGCSSSADEPAPAPAPAPAPTPEDPGHRRTILVYMASANNLGTPGSGFDIANMRQMERWAAGHTLNGCNVVVYHVPNDAAPVPVLKRLTSGGFITEKTYAPLEGTYSTDPATMRQVTDDVMEMYPADEYGLILWSHGLAWVEDASTVSDISPRWWGDDRGRKMSVRALASVLTPEGDTPVWDFIYFDSCYAANIEMAYELRHATPRIIGSTTEVQGAGMPYDKTMSLFTADRVDCAAIAETTFRHYDAKSGTERSCTMSVIDTSGLDRLARICRAMIATGARVPAGYTPIPYAVGQCYSYDMADWYHALTGLQSGMTEEFDAALGACVIYHAATPQMWSILDLSRYCGMGCYIIRSLSAARHLGYDNQQWWTDVMSAGEYDY